ncbi:MAG: hypothetical protein ACAI38_22995 [Myxococcota bacterium]
MTISRVSIQGQQALSAGGRLLGQTTAAVSTVLGLDAASAARVHFGLCCVFVSGSLRNIGLPLNPYLHGSTYTLEPALQQLGWRPESMATAPPGSVAFFSRPGDIVPYHGAFFAGHDGANAYFLESSNDVDLTPQTVRLRRVPVTMIAGAVAALGDGDSVRLVAPVM